MKRRRESEARRRTRLELQAANLTPPQLVDWLQRYTNSFGEAVRIYATQGESAALDVMADNISALSALVAEARQRRGDDVYVPAPDPHLQSLVDRFLEQTRAQA